MHIFFTPGVPEEHGEYLFWLWNNLVVEGALHRDDELGEVVTHYNLAIPDSPERITHRAVEGKILGWARLQRDCPAPGLVVTNPHEGEPPFANMSTTAIKQFLRELGYLGAVNAEERGEVDEQLEALVPALVELRDAGYLKLTITLIASYASLDGYLRLAGDPRISPLVRYRCAGVHDRILKSGITPLFANKRAA